MRDGNTGACSGLCIHRALIAEIASPPFAQAEEGHKDIMGHLLYVASEVARLTGIAESGYRIVTNSGRHAVTGPGVEHFHLHVLGGKQLSWPPGTEPVPPPPPA